MDPTNCTLDTILSQPRFHFDVWFRQVLERTLLPSRFRQLFALEFFGTLPVPAHWFQPRPADRQRSPTDGSKCGQAKAQAGRAWVASGMRVGWRDQQLDEAMAGGHIQPLRSLFVIQTTPVLTNVGP